MNKITNRLMIAAATVVVAAGAASAQTLRADIPFSFRAGSTIMKAGTYRVKAQAGAPVQLASVEDGNSIFMLPLGAGDPNKAWKADGAPVISFECGETMCSLVAVWPGENAPAYRFPRPKLGKDEPSHIATINLYPAKGD
jgi:hypothetical protein